ncbi:MAG: hypothetical protein KI786_12980 [Mameliella sp.]|nr:hypothetical protein [Phaeodactylibacter sp.]NRA49370.1 hypothetical protein [Phaeodactylibacter sp.]
MQNRALQISISLIALFGLIVQCQPIDNRVPPNHDDVYEVRDSIRDVTLLRLGEALQIINRHTERMRRKAYSLPSGEAKKLRSKIKNLEAKYDELSLRTNTLRQDSVLGNWYQELNELDIMLVDLSLTLGVAL